MGNTFSNADRNVSILLMYGYEGTLKCVCVSNFGMEIWLVGVTFVDKWLENASNSEKGFG